MLGVVRALGRSGSAGLGSLSEAREAFTHMGATEGIAEFALVPPNCYSLRGTPRDLSRATERLRHAGEKSSSDACGHARSVIDVEARLALSRGRAASCTEASRRSARAAESTHQWEAIARALAARAEVHKAMGAEIHARRDRERALEVLENTAALLPPDLRSAFWSVPERVARRAMGTGDDSWTPGASAAAVAGRVRPMAGQCLSRRRPSLPKISAWCCSWICHGASAKSTKCRGCSIRRFEVRLN